MLGLMLSTASLILLMLSNKSWYLKIWSLAMLSIISMLSLYTPLYSHEQLNSFVSQDSMSVILIILSFWISLMMLIASQYSVKSKNNNYMLFSLMLVMLNLILISTFMASSTLHFYFLFEASLIPILLMILGWGYQPERLQAGMYMMIYTVAASLPLLLVIMWAKQKLMYYNISMSSILREETINLSSQWSYNLLTLLIFTAFLVKLPMFSMHLWLPKAHVEAPVAGSMILAAILLKLGGYGVFRMYQYFNFYSSSMALLVFSIAIWGGMLTSIVCFRQVDFKALIAYSSIGHMSIMLAGVLSNSLWGWYAGLVIMISHGFCSSALFALANYTYEKTHTRNLMMSKGMLMLLPNLSMWWFLFCVTNMAAPPSINLLGEIMAFPAIIFSSLYYILPLSMMSFLAALYSMYLYSSIQHGGNPKYIKPFFSLKNTALLIMFLHWMPANLLILKSELLFQWI